MTNIDTSKPEAVQLRQQLIQGMRDVAVPNETIDYPAFLVDAMLEKLEQQGALVIMPTSDPQAKSPYLSPSHLGNMLPPEERSYVVGRRKAPLRYRNIFKTIASHV